MKNADMPAMPNSNPDTYPVPVCSEWAYGLTKREMFAMHAMQGLLSNSTEWAWVHYELSRKAVDIADVLLAQLEETNQ